MSRTPDGTRIACDGDGRDGRGCGAVARLPVALRPLLLPDPDDSAAGWYFVARDGAERHYCPACAPGHLARAAAADAAAAAPDASPGLTGG